MVDKKKLEKGKKDLWFSTENEQITTAAVLKTFKMFFSFTIHFSFSTKYVKQYSVIVSNYLNVSLTDFSHANLLCVSRIWTCKIWLLGFGLGQISHSKLFLKAKNNRIYQVQSQSAFLNRRVVEDFKRVVG